jgi:hypothetical protein
MRIERTDKKTVQLGPLDLLCCEFLHQIPKVADPSASEAARRRFFPSPTQGEHPELEKDWQNYVQPELEEWFTSSLEVINGDLSGFSKDTTNVELGQTLEFPLKHLDAWIHGLNQARLSLAAQYDFTDEDMSGEIPIDGEARSLALFQEHFYGLLIECFLRILEDSDL